jgi:hypothetical protein
MRTATHAIVLLGVLCPFGGAAAAPRSTGRAPEGAASATAARPVAALRIEVDHDRALPGSPVTILVRASDRWADPTDADVVLSSTVGEVSAPIRVERGTYRARLVVPTSLPAERAASIVARAGDVVERSTLAISPGPPATVVVDAPETVAANGAAGAILLVRVADEFGNPAEVVPTAEATRGEVRAAVLERPGLYRIAYTPRRLARDGDEVVRVRASDVTATTAMRLVAPATTRFALAPKGGFVLAAGRFRPTLGAELSAWRRVRGEELGLVVEGAWWTFARRDDLRIGAGGATSFSGDQSWLPITGALAWKRPLGSRASASVAVGGGAARVSTRAALAGQPTISRAGWAPAAAAAASLAWWFFRDELFVGVRGAWIGDPGLPTLRGSALPLLLDVGYRFHAG